MDSKNKVVIGIISVAVIIGGLIYFSDSDSNTNKLQQSASLSASQKQFSNERVISFREAPKHIE